MPSRSNPNTPTSLKPKTARTLKTKRQKTQRLLRKKASGTAAPCTSQALRRAAVPSQKKARKLERKVRFARRRLMEEMGEVEMRDVDAAAAAAAAEEAKKETEEKEARDGPISMDVD